MKLLLVITSIAALGSVASAQSAADLMGGLDTVNKGPSVAGSRDCDKAEAEQQAHFDANIDDPQAAVFGGAKLACTYLQRIAWKAPTTKAAPRAKSGKGLPSSTDIVARASDFWANADDMYYVKVVSGGLAGTAWQKNEMSDTPGVPSSRQVNVYTVIVAALADNKTGCFVVYGNLTQENANHPDATKPPSWTASEYKASDWKRAESVACPKGAKAPKPPTN